MTTTEYEHLSATAARSRVTIRRGPRGRYVPLVRTAVVPEHEYAYVVGMHELGHAHVGADEVAAWEWAIAHSARPFTLREKGYATACLASYGITHRVGVDKA